MRSSELLSWGRLGFVLFLAASVLALSSGRGRWRLSSTRRRSEGAGGDGVQDRPRLVQGRPSNGKRRLVHPEPRRGP